MFTLVFHSSGQLEEKQDGMGVIFEGLGVEFELQGVICKKINFILNFST